jgi:glycosyltransferase involved in cell wall biosynthesis
MRILIYNWRDPKNPRAGGAEVYTYEIAKRLVQRGHEVTWFTAAFPGCKQEEVLDGIQIIRAGGRVGVYLQAKRYYRRAFKGKFDVVVDEINTRPFMTPGFVKEPIVTLIHQLAREFWFLETPFPVSVLGYYWLEDRWLRRYRDIPTITVSDSTKQDLERLGFNDVIVVPNGFDVEPLKEVPEKEARPTLLFVGRMTRAKLPDHALEAFCYVKRSIPDVQLWMVGDGPMMKKLMRKCNTDGVMFFGRVSEEKKFELMKKAHILLVPGVREGWGRVVSEANAMGTPAVGYNVPGLRDSIRHGETGLLCRNSPEEMARAALLFLTDCEYASQYAQRALQTVGELSWERSVKAFELCLAKVAG